MGTTVIVIIGIIAVIFFLVAIFWLLCVLVDACEESERISKKQIEIFKMTLDNLEKMAFKEKDD